MSNPKVASSVIDATWLSSTERYSAEQALERLRGTWRELSRGLCSRTRDRIKGMDTPIRSSSTPWWQYLPGSDVVVPVTDPEEVLS